jgi:hypothetical protein
LSGSSPLTCLAWEALPVEYTTASTDRDFPAILHSVSSLDFGSSSFGFQVVWMPLRPLAQVSFQIFV